MPFAFSKRYPPDARFRLREHLSVKDRSFFSLPAPVVIVRSGTPEGKPLSPSQGETSVKHEEGGGDGGLRAGSRPVRGSSGSGANSGCRQRSHSGGRSRRSASQQTESCGRVSAPRRRSSPASWAISLVNGSTGIAAKTVSRYSRRFRACSAVCARCSPCSSSITVMEESTISVSPCSCSSVASSSLTGLASARRRSAARSRGLIPCWRIQRLAVGIDSRLHVLGEVGVGHRRVAELRFTRLRQRDALADFPPGPAASR